MPAITALRQRLGTLIETLYNPDQIADPVTRCCPYEGPDVFATVGCMRTAVSYGSLFPCGNCRLQIPMAFPFIKGSCYALFFNSKHLLDPSY